MKTSFISLWGPIKKSITLLSLCLILTSVYGQQTRFLSPSSETTNFLPDFSSMFVSEFELNDGKVIRGKVVRIVPNFYYEVKLHNGDTITLFEQDIYYKHKVIADIRETRFSYHLGVSWAAPLTPNSSMSGRLFQYGIGYDFGKSMKYSFIFNINSGELYNKDISNGGFMFQQSLLFGYKHNRNKRFSQLFYGGISRTSTTQDFVNLNSTSAIFQSSENTNFWMVTARVELPFLFINKYQLSPYLSYNQPLANNNGYAKQFVMIGALFRAF